MENLKSCRGLKRLSVNEPFCYPSHNDASHNCGQNIVQKMLLHKRHLLVLKLGELPHCLPKLFFL
jgi:hypothetical protein